MITGSRYPLWLSRWRRLESSGLPVTMIRNSPIIAAACRQQLLLNVNGTQLRSSVGPLTNCFLHVPNSYSGFPGREELRSQWRHSLVSDQTASTDNGTGKALALQPTEYCQHSHHHPTHLSQCTIDSAPKSRPRNQENGARKETNK